MKVGNGPNLQMAPPLFENPFHFCGSELPPNVSSTGSNLLLAFLTDGSVSHRGFRAHYTTDEPARKHPIRRTMIDYWLTDYLIIWLLIVDFSVWRRADWWFGLLHFARIGVGPSQSRHLQQFAHVRLALAQRQHDQLFSGVLYRYDVDRRAWDL